MEHWDQRRTLFIGVGLLYKFAYGYFFFFISVCACCPEKFVIEGNLTYCRSFLFDRSPLLSYFTNGAVVAGGDALQNQQTAYHDANRMNPQLTNKKRIEATRKPKSSHFRCRCRSTACTCRK
jgi:hypothetical protein